MSILFQTENKTCKVDTENPLSIAIPLDFYGAQPNAYGVEKAVSKACETDDFIGDTRRGGSCNFEQVKFIPHCNGTHTESIGHITNERISVHDCLKDAFIPAILISVAPENAPETSETYAIKVAASDKLITRKTLESKILNFKFEISNFKPEALIIRTLPNDKSKLTQTYIEEIPPFFSHEAMEFIGEMGVKHLLADLPSIDRIFDEGKLANHRIFWNVKQGSFETSKDSHLNKTITELIFVPDEIPDGIYLLNLQIAPFVAEASPSRPILFRIST